MYPALSAGNFLLYIAEPTAFADYRVHIALCVTERPLRVWGPVPIERSAFSSLPDCPPLDFPSFNAAQKACDDWKKLITSKVK